MRKIIYLMNVSLDGFIEGENGDLSWSVPDEELHQHFNDITAKIGTSIYGRGMYETMSRYWPTADKDPSATPITLEYAEIWKKMQKVVFSKTLDKVDWNSKLLRGNIEEEVAKLKAEPGGDISVSGAGIGAAFMELGLIDEYHLYIRPVLLGSGKRMFPHLSKRIKLKLFETHKFSSGVLLLKYQKVE